MWLVNLPINDPDPISRFEKIKAETSKLKSTKQALGASTLVELSRGTPLTIISLANRVVGPMMRPFNLTVTNVPGPQFPMYLLEAPMLANYPIVPLWSQHGLGLALFSYNGSIAWGVHADFDAIPDIEAVTASIDHAGDELLRASRGQESASRPT
jgi:diacylglycerol O-acyltransferase